MLFALFVLRGTAIAFNITAQIQLQAPGNINQVVNQINNQLKNINANINLKIPPNVQNVVNQLSAGISALNSNLTRLNQTLSGSNNNVSTLTSSLGGLNTALQTTRNSSAQINSTVKQTTVLMDELGRSAGLSARRFLAFSIVANGIIDTFTAIKTAVTAALQYDREFVKLSQVGEAYRSDLISLNQEITRLSTNFGVSSQELLRSAVTLRQAGLDVRQVTGALETLAKAKLAPSFGEDINKVAQGMIAISSQFRIFDRDLSNAISSINAVSNAFSVESQEIITAIQRTGGAFRSIGGDVNEFIALFTSVSSTTRESAEAIGTGLRTIFGRLQRPQTIDELRELGVNLRYTREEAEALGNTNLTEQFVGGYESIRRLSQAIQSLPGTDPRFARIVENVGGLRQLSRVIPLLQEFGTAQNAYNIAVSGGASLTVAADIAQQNFLVNLEKLKESFLGLTRTIVNSPGFTAFADTLLKLGNAASYLLSQISPLIPLLTTLGAIKVATGIGTFLTSFKTGFHSQRVNQGGRIGFARGGVVPGVGNTDTVPADLTPGEFVIKKSSAQNIGYDTLHAMNGGGRARFADGGTAGLKQTILRTVGEFFNKTGVNLSKGYRQIRLFSNEEMTHLTGREAAGLYESVSNVIGLNKKYINNNIESTFVHEALHGLDTLRGLSQGFSGFSYSELPDTPIEKHISKLYEYMFPKASKLEPNIRDYLLDNQEILAHTGQEVAGHRAFLGTTFNDVFNQQDIAEMTAYNKKYIIPHLKTADNINNYPIMNPKSRFYRMGTKLFANGGSTGTDTVPALLTPGEFVFNKIAAQRIGYNTLHQMNKSGSVQRFANGGRVNRADGTPPDFLNGETAEDIYNRLLLETLRQRGDPSILGRVQKPRSLNSSFFRPPPPYDPYVNIGAGYGSPFGFPSRPVTASQFPINTNGQSSDPLLRLLQQIANNTGKTASKSTTTSTTSEEIVQSQAGGLKDKLLGFAALLAIAGGGYVSDFLSQQAGTAQNAAVNSGGNFVGLRAASGGLTTALATGFAGFQIGGPIGAGIGALIGGGLGAAGAANQARSELAGAKAEESQRQLAEVLSIIVGRGTGAISAADSNTISQSIREGFDQIRQKSIADNQRFYIFGTNTSAASAQEVRDRRIFANSQVAAATNVLGLGLSERARDVGRSNLTPEQIRNQLNPTALRGSFSGSQLDLVRLISEGSGQSQSEIFERLSRQVTQQSLQERVRQVNTNNAVARDSITIQFDRLADIIERVNTNFENFTKSLDVTTSLFEGRFSQSQFPNIPNASNLFGLGENGNIIRGISANLGQGGQQFERFGLAFDNILQRLFTVVSANFNQFAPTQQEDFTEIIRNVFDTQLGGRNNLNAEEISILSDVETNLRRVANDNDTLRRLIQSGNRQGLNRELTQNINFPQTFDRIAREFSEAANAFDARVQRFEQFSIEIANSRSQGFNFQRNAAAFSARADFIANGIDPTGLQGVLPLGEANAPILRRARLLAQSININPANAENPEAIGNRQQQIQQRIRQIEEQRSNIFNIRSPEYRQLTLELRSLERQSIQASQALQDLTSAARNQAAQERLSTLVRNRENRISFAERVLTAGPAELADRNRAFQQFFNTVNQNGNISSLPSQTISSIFSALRAGGNIPITELGANPRVLARLSARYGVDASNLTAENVITQELRRDPRTARFVNQTDNEINRVIEEIRRNNDIQNRAQQVIIDGQQRLQDDFFTRLNQGFDRFFNDADRRQAQDNLVRARTGLDVATGARDAASVRVADRDLLRNRFGITNQNQLQSLSNNFEQLIAARNTIRQNEGLFGNISSSLEGFEFDRNSDIRQNRNSAISRFFRNANIDLNQEETDRIITAFSSDRGRVGAASTAIANRDNRGLESIISGFLNSPEGLTITGGILNQRNTEPRNVLRRALQSSGINNQQLTDLLDTVANNRNFRQRVENFRGNGDESFDNVDRVFRNATDAYNRANEEVNRFARNLQNINNGITPQIQNASATAAGAAAFIGLGAAGFLGTRAINNTQPVGLDLGPGFNPNAQIPPPGIVIGPQAANFGNGGAGGIAGIFGRAEELLAAQATATVQAGQNFVQELNPFIDALKNFPHELTGSFTHNVNLNINGAEALQGIEETMKEYVIEQTKDVMRRYIRENLHEAGQLV